MYIQLLIFILAFAGLSIFNEKGSQIQKERARRYYIIFVMTLLAIQSGFRNLGVGPDTLAYYLQFNKTMQYSFSDLWQRFLLNEEKDPAYDLLTKVFSLFFPSFRLFLIAISVVLFTAIGRLYYKYTKSNLDVFISLPLYQCLYYSFLSITGLRQTIATILLFFAVPYAIDRKGIKFILLVILAATQHKSSLIFIPFYLFGFFNSSTIIFIGAILLFVPMFSAAQFISSILVGTSFEQYAAYFEQVGMEQPYVFTAYIICFTVALFFKRKILESINDYNKIFMSSVAVALSLTPLMFISPANMRIVQYFSIFDLFLIPYLCQAYSSKNGGKFLYYGLFFLLSFYVVMKNADYAFFWEDMYRKTWRGLELVPAWDNI